MDQQDTHPNIHFRAWGELGAATTVTATERGVVGFLLFLDTLVDAALEHGDPGVAGEVLAGELLDEVQEHAAVAGAPVHLAQIAADLLVVDDGAVGFLEMLARLPDGHFRQHVAMVVARGFVGENVRDGHERARAEAALDFALRVVGQLQHKGVGELLFGGFVQRLFEVGDSQHGAQHKHLVRVLGLDALLHNGPGDGVAIDVARVLGHPIGIGAQAVQEHGLVLGVGDRGGRALLAEEGAGLVDVGKVRRVPALVHQRRECGEAAYSELSRN